jgi:hypothetical protein
VYVWHASSVRWSLPAIMIPPRMRSIMSNFLFFILKLLEKSFSLLRLQSCECSKEVRNVVFACDSAAYAT